MAPEEFIRDAIEPAFKLLPDKMSAPASRDRAIVQIVAICLQESRLQHRRQLGNGPARGFAQFEKGTPETRGGVTGVLMHTSTRDIAKTFCRARGVPATADAVWSALETDDVLTAGFARMLLWTDPFPLPDLGDAQAAWDLYIRTWRPGRPHRDTWDSLYAQALDAVK